MAGALAASERGLEHAPQAFSLHYQRARMLRALARFDAAESAFAACVGAAARRWEGATPTHVAYAHNEYGHMLAALGRQAEATAQWERSVAVDPAFAQGWVNVAHNYGSEVGWVRGRAGGGRRGGALLLPALCVCVCVCVCVCARARACMCICVCVNM